FFQAEDGIRDFHVTGVQTCALPICARPSAGRGSAGGFADSRPLQILAPQMAERSFEPIKWHVRTLLKDLDTAVALSRQQGSATPISGLAAQLMRLHGSNGNLARDPATLIELYAGQPE